MKKILAFGASTSSTSINRKLANYAAGLVPGGEVTVLDLSAYDLPLYSADEEEASGPPADAEKFLETVGAHDGIVVSMAEHNGSYTAAFKNLYDWASRIELKVWSARPMLLLSASPGGRGGASVMEAAKATFPRMGADVLATFSLPSFYDNFEDGTGITDPDLAGQLQAAVDAFAAGLNAG